MDGKLKKQLPVRAQMVWYLLAIVLILVASGFRVLDRGMYNSFWSVWLQLLRHMIHIGLLIGWMIFHPVEDFTKAGSQVFAGNWVHAQLLAVCPCLKMDVICA